MRAAWGERGWDGGRSVPPTGEPLSVVPIGQLATAQVVRLRDRLADTVQVTLAVAEPGGPLAATPGGWVVAGDLRAGMPYAHHAGGPGGAGGAAISRLCSVAAPPD
jgi:hypothetical protein